MATWVTCTNENRQIIYANLGNAITLFRDGVRHRGTVIAFMGSGKRCHRGKRYARPNPGIGEGIKFKLRHYLRRPDFKLRPPMSLHGPERRLP